MADEARGPGFARESAATGVRSPKASHLHVTSLDAIEQIATAASQLAPGAALHLCLDATCSADFVAATMGSLGLVLEAADGRSITARRPMHVCLCDDVRRSCCLLPPGDVIVDIPACLSFARDLARHAVPGADTEAPFHDKLFPARTFSSLEQEVSAVVLVDCLNFGSGYKPALAAHRLGQYRHGEYGSAYAFIFCGVEGMLDANCAMDAETMAAWTDDDTFRCWGFPPAVKAENASSANLQEFGAMLTAAIVSAGLSLKRKGWGSLGAFVLHVVAEAPESARAERLVDGLVDVLPPFRDAAPSSRVLPVMEQRVHFYKKAQLVVASLRNHFGGRDDRFRFDSPRLTVSSDNVLPAVLRARGCIRCAEGFARRIDEGLVLDVGEEEVALRAAAVRACEAMLSAMRWIRTDGGAAAAAAERGEGRLGRSSTSAAELDLLLWGYLGKSTEFRGAPRHFTRGTWAY